MLLSIISLYSKMHRVKQLLYCITCVLGMINFYMYGECTKIRKPFISSWYNMSVNGTSPLVIAHQFNEIPVKVDVQVKLLNGQHEYVLPGLGSVPKDDDLPGDYGGVAYSYNASHVMLFVPVKELGISEGSARVATSGGISYNGPFTVSETTCQVRIRAWKLSDWPKPDFSLINPLTISTEFPYKQVPHCLGVYPDMVTVQLILSDGMVSEGIGTASITMNHDGSDVGVSICGTIFGFDDTAITLWAPSKNNDFVACYRDGWGDSVDITATQAMVRINAWVLTPTNFAEKNRFAFAKNSIMTGTISLSQNIDLDSHLVILEVKENSLSTGRVFYGAGSANLGNPGEAFGGVVYGYSQSEILLWTPIVPEGHLIYIGGVWGDGSDTLMVNSVQISIKVIIAGFKECPEPVDIPNALKMNNGLINGSTTLYACVPGYLSNGGNVQAMCNGTDWSPTNLSCGYTVFTTQPPTCPDNINVSHVSRNFSLEELQEIILSLKVNKSNTSGYRRSLTCAYDPRPSSFAIGTLGISLICGMIAILFIADCATVMKTSKHMKRKNRL